MRSQRNPVGVVLAVLVLLLAALPALAVKTVSTSDGMTLTLTDTGAFSSLTVDGNTAPTLSGVAGGFYIVPMDGVAFNAARTTYYAGTQVTGTATQSGSDIHVTGTAQNQSFDIWLRGGLPYIKVEGTVTGPARTTPSWWTFASRWMPPAGPGGNGQTFPRPSPAAPATGISPTTSRVGRAIRTSP